MATDKLLIIGLSALIKPFVVFGFLCFVRAIHILMNKAMPDSKFKSFLNRKI